MPDTDNRRVDPRWAWQRYRATREAPWDIKKAGHLYRRAAFGATLPELEEAVEAGAERAIDRLLEGRADSEHILSTTSDLAAGIRQGNAGQLASAWWLYRMLYTPHPLREKLTLFWHNHFATSNRKVNNAGYMLDQYELMRRHAQGSFRTLLRAMTSDKAMMVWLDTNQSRRDRPNENYARELMELFSLGINNYRRPDRRNYTEQDIRAAARAFTGWRIENGRAVFRDNDHDSGEKTLLGETGRWRADDVVRICLEQESAPYFIVAKLFKFLVSETIPATPELLAPLATRFRDSDYNFGELVETVLRSNLFFSPQAYRTKIKSPVEFAIGIARGLQERPARRAGPRERPVDERPADEPLGIGTTQLVLVLEGLGQRPFYPPSVAGWDGGRAWLNGQTLLFRQNLALALTSTTDDRFGRRCDPAALARRHNRQSDEEIVDFFASMFLQGDIPKATRDRVLAYSRRARDQTVPAYWTERDAADQRVRAVCHLVLTLPEFQLN